MIHKLHTIPIRMPTGYWVEIGKFILKLTCECNRPRIIKTILKKKNKTGGLYLTWKLACYDSDSTRKRFWDCDICMQKLYGRELEGTIPVRSEGSMIKQREQLKNCNSCLSRPLREPCNQDSALELPCHEVREAWLLYPESDHSLATGFSQGGTITLGESTLFSWGLSTSSTSSSWGNECFRP